MAAGVGSGGSAAGHLDDHKNCGVRWDAKLDTGNSALYPVYFPQFGVAGFELYFGDAAALLLSFLLAVAAPLLVHIVSPLGLNVTKV